MKKKIRWYSMVGAIVVASFALAYTIICCLIVLLFIEPLFFILPFRIKILGDKLSFKHKLEGYINSWKGFFRGFIT